MLIRRLSLYFLLFISVLASVLSCSEKAVSDIAEITVIVSDSADMKLIGPEFDGYSIDYCRIVLEEDGRIVADSGMIEGGDRFSVSVIASARYTAKAYGYHSSDGTADDGALTMLGYGETSFLPLEQGNVPVVVQLYADGATPPGDATITLTLPESMTTYSYEFAYMYDITYPDGRTLLHTPEWIIGNADNGSFSFTIPGEELKPGRYVIVVTVMNNAYEAEASMTRAGMDTLLLVAGEPSSGTIDVRIGTSESNMAVSFIDRTGQELLLQNGALITTDLISDGILSFACPEGLSTEVSMRVYLDGVEMPFSVSDGSSGMIVSVEGLSGLDEGSHKLVIIAYDPLSPLSVGSAAFTINMPEDNGYESGTVIVRSFSDLAEELALGADEVNLGFMDENGDMVLFPTRIMIAADGRRPLYEIAGLRPINRPLSDFFVLSVDGELSRTDGGGSMDGYHCLALPDEVLSLGDAVLSGCQDLHSIHLPSDLVSIGNSAFEGSGIAYANISGLQELSDIGERAFADTESLVEMAFPENITSLAEDAFSGSSVQKLVFDGCGKLPEIAIAGAQALQEVSASDCSSLVSFSVSGSSGLTRVSDAAFRNCTSLLSVSLPDSVESIGKSAFSHCTALTEFRFPSSLVEVGPYAFADSAIGSIDLSRSSALIEIGSRAFAEAKNASSIIFPESLVSIDEYAFENCIGLLSADMSAANNLTSISSYAFTGCSSLMEAILPEGLIRIDGYAFRECSSLSSIVLPSTLEEIGEYLFQNCTSLLEADLSACSSITSLSSIFDGCTALKSASLPSGISSIEGLFSGCSALESLDISLCTKISKIGERAFQNCTSLKEIILPASIRIIDEYAFYGCSSLQSVNFQDLTELGYIYRYAFAGCKSLVSIDFSKHDSLRLSNDVFSNCSGLESAVLPEHITEIPSDLFYNCTSLASVTVSGNLKKIGTYAFNGTAFTEVDLSGYTKLEEIGNYAFYNNKKLGSVQLPENLEIIGNGAFQGCSSLVDITIPESVTLLGYGAFRDCTALIKADLSKAAFDILGKYNSSSSSTGYVFYGCRALSEVLLPQTLRIIGDSSFYSCDSLKSISIPSALEEIRNKAFYDSGLISIDLSGCPDLRSIGEACFDDCYNLESADLSGTILEELPVDAFYRAIKALYLPDTIESIPDGAFSSFYNLETINIPASLREIGSNMFSNCDKLQTIDLSGCHELERIEENAFYSCGKLASVIFPESEKLVYVSGFYYCTALSMIDMSMLTGDVEIGINAFRNCTALTEIRLPENTANIGNASFRDCSKLTTAALPGSIMSIGDEAFRSCRQLQNMVMPSDLTSIGSYAFYYCQALTEMNLSGCGNLKDIGDYAFYYCSNMEEIRIPSSVETVGEYAVSYTKGPIIIDLDTRPSGWSSDWRRNYSGSVSWLPKN